MYAADATYRSLTLRQAFGSDKLGMTGRRIVVIPNAVRDLYMAVSAYIALREQSLQLRFAGMYAADATYRSLDKLGMTGRRGVVIPNAVRDLYMAVSAYIALCEQSLQPPFAGMYAAGDSHRSLDKLGMTERRACNDPL